MIARMGLVHAPGFDDAAELRYSSSLSHLSNEIQNACDLATSIVEHSSAYLQSAGTLLKSCVCLIWYACLGCHFFVVTELCSPPFYFTLAVLARFT